MGNLAGLFGIYKRSELVKSFLDDIAETEELRHNLFHYDKPDLVKHYIDGQIEFHIQFTVSGDKYAAIFHNLRAAKSGLRHIHSNHNAPTAGFGDLLRDCRICYYEKPVLVYDVEPMEKPKAVIPSLVRLQPLDYVESIFSQDAYFSFLEKREKLFGTLTYGEFCALTSERFIRRTAGQLTGEQIQR